MKASNTLANGPHSRKKLLCKITLMILILGLLALLGHYFGDQVPRLEAFIEARGAFAPVFFALLFCLLPLVVFPTDPLCFAAGALFGIGLGFLLAGASLVGSAILMFFIARYFARAPIQKMLTRHPKLRRFDKSVAGGGMKVLLLLRLAPLPFAPLSYFLGSTKVSFGKYFWSIFATFGTVLVAVYYGSIAKHVTKLAGKTESFSPSRDLSLFAGLIISVIVLATLTHYARKSLKEITQDPQS